MIGVFTKYFRNSASQNQYEIRKSYKSIIITTLLLAKTIYTNFVIVNKYCFWRSLQKLSRIFCLVYEYDCRNFWDSEN